MAFDFSAVTAPFRMQPGLRRLAPGALQLTPNVLADAALAAKLSVLSQHAHQALLRVPGFDAAPALQALADHAAAAHPDAFAVRGPAHWHAPRLGWSVHDGSVAGNGPPALGDCLRALPPAWRGAALLSLAFAEDFALLDGATGCVPWLAVCLPSHWAPEDKVGRHFAQIHAPVADNQTLLTASEHLVRLVTGSDRWERFVWTITGDPALDRHPARCTPTRWPAEADADADADAEADAESIAESAWFRTERQTFIPVAGHAQAIFTIHVEVRALADAVASAAQARQLHAALSTMSAEVLAYRGLTDARARLVAWLAARAGAAPP